jgi:transcription initiation factor TFIID subunit 2
LDKLLLFYKLRFFGSNMTLPAPHDFQDLQEYFVKKAVAASIGSIKGSDGFTPPAVLRFLLDLLKNNDNSINSVSSSNVCLLLLIQVPCT